MIWRKLRKLFKRDSGLNTESVSYKSIVDSIEDIVVEVGKLLTNLNNFEKKASKKKFGNINVIHLKEDPEKIMNTVAELANLSFRVLAQKWVLYFNDTLEEVKSLLVADSVDCSYGIYLIKVLALISTSSFPDDFFIVINPRDYRHKRLNKKLKRLINNINKISIEKRVQNFEKVKEYALELKNKFLSMLSISGERLIEELQIDDFNNFRWYSALFIAFASDEWGIDIQKEIGFFLKVQAEQFNDEVIVRELDEVMANLEVSINPTPEVEQTLTDIGLDKLSSEEREYLEKVLDTIKDILDINLDLEYVRNHPDEFIETFEILVVGVENAVTIVHSFLQKESFELEKEAFEEPLHIDETYFEVLWEDLRHYFDIKDDRNITSKIEQCSESKFFAAIQELSIECMAFILGKVQEYKTEEVYILMPKDIDVDFERLNIREKSGLSKEWRKRFAKALRTELIMRASEAGIPVIKMDITLEEQYGDYSEEFQE